MKNCSYCGLENPDEAMRCRVCGTDIASSSAADQTNDLAKVSKKQSRTILREIIRMYQNCPERVATYTRLRWAATVTAWVLIFIAVMLSVLPEVNNKLGLAIAFLAGVAFAFSIFFAASARQLPYLLRYSTLREDDIKRDLEELGNAA